MAKKISLFISRLMRFITIIGMQVRNNFLFVLVFIFFILNLPFIKYPGVGNIFSFIILFLTLYELRTQRSKSQEPTIILLKDLSSDYYENKIMRFLGKTEEEEFYKKGISILFNNTCRFHIINIGNGTARDIKIKWFIDTYNKICDMPFEPISDSDYFLFPFKDTKELLRFFLPLRLQYYLISAFKRLIEDDDKPAAINVNFSISYKDSGYLAFAKHYIFVIDISNMNDFLSKDNNEICSRFCSVFSIEIREA